MNEKYAQIALENTMRLLAIDSPSGYTKEAAKFVQKQFTQLGYDAKITRKGGVLVCLNPALPRENAVCLPPCENVRTGERLAGDTPLSPYETLVLRREG